MSQTETVCKQYLAGDCRWGSNCKFSHRFDSNIDVSEIKIRRNTKKSQKKSADPVITDESDDDEPVIRGLALSKASYDEFVKTFDRVLTKHTSATAFDLKSFLKELLPKCGLIDGVFQYYTGNICEISTPYFNANGNIGGPLFGKFGKTTIKGGRVDVESITNYLWCGIAYFAHMYATGLIASCDLMELVKAICLFNIYVHEATTQKRTIVCPKFDDISVKSFTGYYAF